MQNFRDNIIKSGPKLVMSISFHRLPQSLGHTESRKSVSDLQVFCVFVSCQDEAPEHLDTKQSSRKNLMVLALDRRLCEAHTGSRTARG